ncbi:hypothetical protein MHYP_G00075690 [Metynnis hypsauchen]
MSAINKGPFSVCFEGFGHTLLGHLPDSLCPYTVTPCNGSSSSNCSALAPDEGTTPSSYVTDWYWVCSYKVYVTLPENWGGRCAFTLFNSSLILISHNPLGGAHIARRNKRSSDDDFPPPEHQLKSKADKFWECLFPQYGLTQVWNQLEVTHYRLATFTNATRMALQGVKDELTALRLTTMQNRMALDLLLAEEGGVCAMVGDSCCTYIPANDEDHGSIAVALDRMRQVSTELQLDEHGVCETELHFRACVDEWLTRLVECERSILCPVWSLKDFSRLVAALNTSVDLELADSVPSYRTVRGTSAQPTRDVHAARYALRYQGKNPRVLQFSQPSALPPASRRHQGELWTVPECPLWTFCVSKRHSWSSDCEYTLPSTSGSPSCCNVV